MSIKFADGIQSVQCSALRKGGYVCLAKGNRKICCKITDMSSAKTGKHGGLKVHLTTKDVSDNKTVEAIYSSVDMVEVPNTASDYYQVLEIEEGDGVFEVQIMNHQSEAVDSPLKMEANQDLSKEIKEKFDDGSNVYQIRGWNSKYSMFCLA